MIENENQDIEYSEDLETSFQIILSNQNLDSYIYDICDLIIQKTISRKEIDRIICDNKVSIRKSKKDLSELIIFYIEITLRDNVLTEKELSNIRFLKILFRIEEGDLLLYNRVKIDDIMNTQLTNINLNNFTSQKEKEILQNNLREVFDIPYDIFEKYEKIKNPYQEQFVNNEKENKIEDEKKSNITNNESFANITTSKEIDSSSFSKMLMIEAFLTSIYLYNNLKYSWISIPFILVLIIIIIYNNKIVITILNVLIPLFLAIISGLFFNTFLFDFLSFIIGVLTFLFFYYLILPSDSIFKKNENRNRQIPGYVKKNVWERDAGKCVLCGSNVDIEFDHILPFSKGGGNTIDNVRILCKNCNRKKSAKLNFD